MSEKTAIDGGTPVRSTPLAYGRQWIEEDDIAAVTETLKSDYLTSGPKITELEDVLCAYTGAKYAVAMNSGTAVLHAATHAAGIGEGDEVIVTPFTFMASANSALYVGARPVFADIDPETWNIDPASVEAHVTKKTRAIVAVDYGGEAVDADALRAICDRHHLVFIEDAAHAIGTKYKGRPTGSYADITTMSFHPVKTVTSGEGGAVLTNNADFARDARLLRAHGMEHDPSLMRIDAPAGDDGTWLCDQLFLGYNYRMPDLDAALLLSQMKKIDRFIARRKELVAHYDAVFADMPEIIPQKHMPWSDAARHLYAVRLDLSRLSCTRKQFFDAMRAENIFCQVHYIPTYLFSHYRSLGYQKGLCPVAEEVYASVFSLPLFPKMTDEDQDDAVRAVKKVTKRYAV
ncbi:MAG: UDP-4-amino-4,6-dideoxy-N-acetyl-beta-L-altrosamine transaminase [Lachnospiraceae bacterium]|nr:UDP-4-amino-4,6-dideoxy-N-acetyl-beta-L-altrosamine transaminase [Lachnospiraceae bacterium]